MAKTSYTGATEIGAAKMSVFLVWAGFPNLPTRVARGWPRMKLWQNLGKAFRGFPAQAEMTGKLERKNNVIAIDFAIIQAPFCGIIRGIKKA